MRASTPRSRPSGAVTYTCRPSETGAEPRLTPVSSRQACFSAAMSTATSDPPAPMRYTVSPRTPADADACSTGIGSVTRRVAPVAGV